MCGNEYKDALAVFPDRIKRMLCNIPNFSTVSEIRLRCGGALCATGSHGICYLRDAGYSYTSDEGAYIVTRKDLTEVIERSCGYSVFAHESELCSGFITYAGGHRIGISGNVFGSNGSISQISSLCVRIAREYPRAADGLVDVLYRNSLPGVIIAGAPGSGKTTMLRSAARALAEGRTERVYRVSVVDERYELAGRNAQAYSLCGYADIVSGCPKSEGILRAVRLLSPELVVCDEIGSCSEAESISSVLTSGVKFLVSIHAGSFSELAGNSRFRVLRAAGAFDFAVLLSSSDKPGCISTIYDLRGDCDEIFCCGAHLRGAVCAGTV